MFTYSIKKFVLVFLILPFFVAPQYVYADGWTLTGEITGTPQFLTVGDRVNITLKVFTQNRKPLTQDKKFTLKIFNPKPGHNCVTTDDNLKDDATILGYCEATGDAGNMEIGVGYPAGGSTFEVDGVRYEPIITSRYNAMFIDPKTSCQGTALAPTNISLLKQNDITVKVEWQNTESFVGSYDVLYGTTPGEYNGKKHTENKNVIIDSLDPKKDYYIKVQAVSACKWTATSSLYKYTPLSGAVSPASEKAKITPAPTTKPTTQTVIKVSPSPVATSSADVPATPSSTTEMKPKISILERIWGFLKSLFWK